MVFRLEPLEVKDLKGLWDRGRDDEVPPDHCITAHNVQYDPRGVRMRDGSVLAYDTGGLPVVRFFYRRAENVGNTLLFLTSDGRLYGVRNGVQTLLLSNSSMIDFSITDDADRIFITPHNRETGLPGEKIYWWDGTTFSQVGAPAPIGSQMVITETGEGIDEVQKVEIINATGGTFKLRTPFGLTVELPYNITTAQLESALRGDNERQSIDVSGATGGGFTITREGVSGTVLWNATIAQFTTVLNEIFMPLGGTSSDFFVDSAVSSDGGPWVVVFIGNLAKQNVPLLDVDGAQLTGTNPQVTIDTILPGRTLYGVNNVFVTGTNPFTVTWKNAYGERNIATLISEEENFTGSLPRVEITTITEGETAGKIEPGLRKFAVAYETAYGHITRPGPLVGGIFTPSEYNAPGDLQAIVQTIPIGPVGTVARHLLATKANEEEYFFIPEGRVPNNVDTTFTVDFFDSDLIESADYLFDIAESVPAALGLCQYEGRMVAWGFPDPDGSLLRISRAGSFESFDEIEGLRTVTPADRFGIKACSVLRGILYVIKKQGAHATQDNQQEPAFWETTVIDNGVGTVVNGISSIPNVTAGSTRDRWLIADVSGLLLFDGVFRTPDLTWKINDIWLRINKNYLNTVQVWDDPVHQRIYINVPLDSATAPTHVLYGDYAGGLSAQGIKWSIWDFPQAPLSISVFDLAGNGVPIFRYGAIVGIWRSCDHQTGPAPTITSDNGYPIDPYFETWLMAGMSAGLVNQFNSIRLRIIGSGNLDITLRGQDRLPVLTPPLQILASTPAKDYNRLCNFVNERVSVEFRMNAVDEWFNFYEGWIFHKPYSAQRPA